MRLLICSVTMVAIALAAPSVLAQPAPAQPAPFASERAEARERLHVAQDLFERGNFDGALAEFQRLYDLLQGSPQQARVLYNVAQCQEQLGRYDEALVGYRRYLDAMGDGAPNRDEVQGLLRALEGFLAVIHVESSVPGAEVWIDERRVGTAPGDVRVPGGRHVVQLRAPGHLPSQQEVQLAGRATRTLRFALERIPPPQRGLTPAYFWVATGATALTAAVGAGFGVAALVADRDAEARLADPARMFTVTEATRSETRTRANVADALYGTALAFGVGAAVLFAFTDFRRASGSAPPRTALHVAPWSDGRGAGLVLGGAL